MLDVSRRRRTGTPASATAVAAVIVLALASAPVSRAQTAVPGDFGNAAPIAVTLTSYEINPSQLTLTHGVAYRLHLTNASGKAHNFAAPKLFAASSIAPADQSKIEDGKIEVGGGESVDVAFVPTTPGEYDVRCTHFMHSVLGMHAKAVVR